MSITTDEDDERPPSILLEDAPWDLYMKLLEDFADAHVRVNYFEGRMEIMPGSEFDRVKSWLAEHHKS